MSSEVGRNSPAENVGFGTPPALKQTDLSRPQCADCVEKVRFQRRSQSPRLWADFLSGPAVDLVYLPKPCDDRSDRRGAPSIRYSALRLAKRRFLLRVKNRVFQQNPPTPDRRCLPGSGHYGLRLTQPFPRSRRPPGQQPFTCVRPGVHQSAGSRLLVCDGIIIYLFGLRPSDYATILHGSVSLSRCRIVSVQSRG